METNEERLYATIINLAAYKEIIGWKCILSPYQSELNFFNIRKTPKEYVKSELEWYLSCDLDVSKIEKKAKLWSEIKSTKNKVNSNYGWCIFHKDNHLQYTNCIVKLLQNPASRQASMIYTRPSMHMDATTNKMKDFMCTNYVQVLIREDRLVYIVHQRSCDFVYGFFNDFAWHCYVFNKLEKDLAKHLKGEGRGTIIYICDSLHIYDKHYEMIDKIAAKILLQGIQNDSSI
ncbi:TPA: hypothetical protein RTG63_001722 [Campylobacter jejuni]|nr:hypothetical protein [Campylobacter jejuni]